ncbi:alpha/beta-hydrolase [Dothidotthia symphoricarpi CBS 119687]|uniref:Alpha/beta-hydrolase n=1 Tax=Dothidotthia symphoricarpi CBS 119687 TaxID=1392245 RepID=A0A6A6AAX2_9PLEO|nr:alpha/beta-hydrolase [Dothidotthia symphoricarpi CBS 119687]KAF2128295.1 alpha/beta-hydrolase [Dothidotthia symphoricarpi CBS 119687]
MRARLPLRALTPKTHFSHFPPPHALHPAQPIPYALPPQRPCTRTLHSTPRRSEIELAYRLHDNNGQAKGAPIVMIHGLFGSKRNNQSVSNVLARTLSRPVYALDTRNHGTSPHHATHTYAALASDLSSFLSTHNLRETCLIGHSMGAKTIMTLALRDPSRISSIIPVDNAPVDAALPSDFPIYTKGMLAVDVARPGSQKAADAVLAPYVPDVSVRQFLLTNLHRPVEGGPLCFRIPVKILAGALGNMADFPYGDPETRRFEGRALFIRGTKSRYVSDEVVPIIGRFFPRFRMVDVECGHWVVSERPEAFLEAVVEFLREEE